jgi:D-glycero-D-manno-heptose 1,7-bisphosphate phosphatase
LNKVKSNKIAFLDRDGIINVDHGYVHKIQDFQFVEGFLELFSFLVEKGFIPVVITNQSGVARGYYTLDEVHKFHNHINTQLNEKCSSTIHSFYICPHHEKGTLSEYSISCNCRKPLDGMIDQFEKNFGSPIDYSNSIMIGDKKSDVGVGKNRNLKTFQLDSGKYELHQDADHVVESLSQIARILQGE